MKHTHDIGSEQLRLNILQSLANEPELQNENITIEIVNDAVVLLGEVNSEDLKKLAEKTIYEVREVTSVMNKLKVLH